MTSAKDLAAPAQAVLEDFGDRDYAASVYAGAEEKLSAPKELIILADEVMRNLKDQERAVTLDEQAARECMTGTAYVQLANRLRQYGLDRDIWRWIYAIGKRKSHKEHQERLRWAKGIFDVLQGLQWASEAYGVLAKSMTSEPERRAFVVSCASRLERRFYWDALCLPRVGVAGFVHRANKRPRRSGVTSPRGGWAIKEEPAKLARNIIHACGCRSLRIINGDRGENEPFLERNAVFACSGFGFLRA